VFLLNEFVWVFSLLHVIHIYLFDRYGSHGGCKSCMYGVNEVYL
jgi:hypothetical protein